MNYTITRKDRTNYFFNPLRFGLLIDLIIAIGFNLYEKISFSDGIWMFLLLILAQSIMFYVPLITFYFNYLSINGSSIFKVLNNNRFGFKHNLIYTEFELSDVREIVYYMSIPKKDGRRIYAAYLNFYYAKIYTTKGDFIITCLLCDELEQIIKVDNVTKISSHIEHAFPK